MPEDFTALLRSYLQLVERKTEAEAEAVIKKHSDIVDRGALSGDVVATAAEIHGLESGEGV